jgi:hypothetical protein
MFITKFYIYKYNAEHTEHKRCTYMIYDNFQTSKTIHTYALCEDNFPKNLQIKACEAKLAEHKSCR